MHHRRLPSPSPPPPCPRAPSSSLLVSNHILRPFPLQPLRALDLAVTNTLHVLIDRVLVAVEAFEGDDEEAVGFRVAGHDLADAGPGDVLAVVDGEVEGYFRAAGQPGGPAWRKGRRGSCLVADADLGGGFGEDEIGDAGVVHVDGAELVAGFDDGEHACIAEVFAVADVEVLENGGAGGLGKVLEDAVGDVFYFFHVEVGQEWGVFEKVLECIVGQSDDVGDLEAGEFGDIVCQAFDSLVVELMAPAEVEVSEVARRYDCSVGQRVNLGICSV